MSERTWSHQYQGPETLIKPYLFNFHLFFLQVCKKFLLPFCKLFLDQQKRGHLIYCSARNTMEPEQRRFPELSLSRKPEDTRKRNIKGWKNLPGGLFVAVSQSSQSPEWDRRWKKNKNERSSDLLWKFLISYRVTEKFLPIQPKYLGVYNTA